MSRTQIDRLGDRLKKGNIIEADLRLLDAYRRSFTDAYELVVGAIRETLGLEPTGRPAKSTTSISEKLRRESIRLTQIQDIAGCRITVSDIATQGLVVSSIEDLFGYTKVVTIDRRPQPSHGYRAVHVVVSTLDKLIEIQIRTELQHLWAELSEKFSDVIDPAIKYGGGDEKVRRLLDLTSKTVQNEEMNETVMKSAMWKLVERGELSFAAMETQLQDYETSRQELFIVIRGLIDNALRLWAKGEPDDLSD